MAEVLKAAMGKDTVAADQAQVREVVAGVIADVRSRGDCAVREYSEKFDNWSPENFKLSADEVERIVSGVDRQVIADIKAVQANVRNFAQRQKDSLQDFEVETDRKSVV